jgi:hypothetical protein
MPESSPPASGSSTVSSTTVTLEQRVGKVMANKQLWLDWAEITDAWRLVPRAILAVLLLWNVYLIDRIWSWYAHLPSAERTTADAALIGGIITAITSMFTLSLKFYQNSGRRWNGQPPQDQ